MNAINVPSISSVKDEPWCRAGIPGRTLASGRKALSAAKFRRNGHAGVRPQGVSAPGPQVAVGLAAEGIEHQRVDATQGQRVAHA